MSDNQAETALPGVVVTREDNQALELDELKALCAAATEGPWVWGGAYLEGGPGGYSDVISPGDVKCGLYCQGGTSVVEIASADAAFIAAARTAVPVLIAEVERLTQERDEARDIAVALEQQTAEALKNARIGLALTNDVLRRESLREVVRILETENQ